MEVYGELVIVTIVSFVAAKAWFKWFSRFAAEYIGTSLTSEFFIALALTAAAIFILHTLFSRKKHKDKKAKLAKIQWI